MSLSFHFCAFHQRTWKRLQSCSEPLLLWLCSSVTRCSTAADMFRIKTCEQKTNQHFLQSRCFLLHSGKQVVTWGESQQRLDLLHPGWCKKQEGFKIKVTPPPPQISKHSRNDSISAQLVNTSRLQHNNTSVVANGRTRFCEASSVNNLPAWPSNLIWHFQNYFHNFIKFWTKKPKTG